MSAEKDQVSRKLQRLNGGKEVMPERSGSGTGLHKDMELVLDGFRRKVKCSLCMHNDKDAIISKCMHAFCRECIQRRLDNRNRKCPACALQFDYQSVKDLFLTS